MERWEFDDLLIGQMESLYGKYIPDGVMKRYVREKNYLQLSEYQNEFRAFGELLLNMKQKQMKYSMIGTAWHSFLLYLLLQPELNPLPPHYYCPQCKEIIFVEDNEEISIGIDLPERQCKCGCEMRGDGFDLSEEFFWEKEQLDLGFSVSEKDYEYVKAWLSSDVRLKDKDIEEDDWSHVDEEDIVKRYKIGIITVLAEKTDFQANEIGWDEVRKHKEKVIKNYELLLPCNQKIGNTPQNIYEVIRMVAFFSTMYTKSTEHYVSEDDILDSEEMYSLLEEFYNNDINKAPVFQEDGLMPGEWAVGEYSFLILFTRAFAEFVLDEINDKMGALFEEEEINE